VANTKSAKKAVRANVARTLRNRSAKSAIKTFVVKARKAIDEKGETAPELVTTAVSSLDRAASKGIIHKNNASRRKARLMARVAAAALAPVKVAAPVKAAKVVAKPRPAKAKVAAKPKTGAPAKKV
jgi:small subunit ribosomal protein S20